MHEVGSKFALGMQPDPAPQPTVLFKTTRAMISDPKLPFADRFHQCRGIQISGRKRPTQLLQFPIAKPSPALARLWLRRIGVLLFVFLCATLGVMLVILPWRPEWSDNPLLLAYPAAS